MGKRLKSLPEKVKEKALFIVNSVIIYALIYFVEYQVPFHSDDYSFYLMGLSLDDRLRQYINWSGRFITDFTASFLLNIFEKPIYMAINSFVLLAVIIIISILPNIVRKEKKITRGSSIILWIVFMLYWVSNPNLGQTTFWIVGSANYLWTLFWASLYFAFFLYLLNKDSTVTVIQNILLFLSGIFAGLSNEAVGFSVVLFTIAMFFIYWKEKRFSLIVGLLSSAIGYAFMIFAPGNYSRLNFYEFDGWRELSFVDKFLQFFWDRMPGAFGDFYLVYLLFIFMLIAVLWIQNGKKIDDKAYTFSFIFMTLSVCTICMFVVSPYLAPRSESTSLYYSLLALSFIAYILIDSEKWERIISFGVLTAVCGIFFIISYTFLSYAYVQTNTQAGIREFIIKEAKYNGNDTAVIPDWYFTRLPKDSDKFDTFRSGDMPKYYGLNNIEWKNVTFNYAVIENTKPININEKLMDGLTLSNMYVKFNAPFEQTIVFEFDNSLFDFVQEGEKNLYIHLIIDGRDGFYNADLDLNDFVQIGEKYYYGRTILTPRIDKISWIDYGFYNPDAGINSATFSLDFKKYYSN